MALQPILPNNDHSASFPENKRGCSQQAASLLSDEELCSSLRLLRTNPSDRVLTRRALACHKKKDASVTRLLGEERPRAQAAEGEDRGYLSRPEVVALAHRLWAALNVSSLTTLTEQGEEVLHEAGFRRLHRAICLSLLEDAKDAECEYLAEIDWSQSVRQWGRQFTVARCGHLARLRALWREKKGPIPEQSRPQPSLHKRSTSPPSSLRKPSAALPCCLDFEGFLRAVVALAGTWTDPFSSHSGSLDLIFVLRTIVAAVVLRAQSPAPASSSSTPPEGLLSDALIVSRNAYFLLTELADEEPSSLLPFSPPGAVFSPPSFRALQQRPVSPQYSDPSLKRLHLISREMRLDDDASLDVPSIAEAEGDALLTTGMDNETTPQQEEEWPPEKRRDAAGSVQGGRPPLPSIGAGDNEHHKESMETSSVLRLSLEDYSLYEDSD